MREWEIGQEGPIPGTPEGLNIDAKCRLYVSDYDQGVIEVYTPEGEFLISFGEAKLDALVDIAISADGLEFVTDHRANLLQIYRIW